MSDYRYNPLTGQFVPEDVTDEEHTIEFWAEINAYGIKIQNGIQLTNPRTVTVVENNSGAAVFTEQTARVAPNAGQFWVDYDAATFTGTAWILFNASDNGKDVLVSYKSLGLIARSQAVIDQIVSGVLDEAFDEEFFGDGSDGDATISSGTTTLTRDTFYNNLTISGTGSLDPAGFRIFVRGTLNIASAPAGAIAMNGSDGGDGSGNTPGTGGSGTSGVTVGGSEAGADGGAGTLDGDSTVGLRDPANGGVGGSGGDSDGLGNRSGGSISTLVPHLWRVFWAVADALLRGSTLLTGGGGGGGGAGAAGARAGGGGASGGGVVFVAARTILRGASTAVSAISAVGGKGGNSPTDGSNPAGGGGGGGGWVAIIYRFLTGATASDCIDVSGGNGGNGNAVTGGVGYGGMGGGGGRVSKLDVTDRSVSISVGTTGTTASDENGGAGESLTVDL